jgi:hypothetical protein
MCGQEESFTLPGEVQARMTAYAERFFVLKQPRKLVPYPPT